MSTLDLFGPPSDPPLSEHLKLEIAAAHERGEPLASGEHVPGCHCHRCAPDAGSLLELYDFQLRSVDQLRANIRERDVKSQILSAPTGSGKTVLATHLLAEAQKKRTRAVFVCDRIPLIDQTSRMLDRYGIPHGVIQADHWRWRPWEKIQVASAQTLGKRKWPEDLSLIIVDEAHSLHKSVLARIARRDCVVIGLTATPFTRGLGQHYDAVVSVTTTRQLIEQGYLSPYRIFAASEPDMTGVKVTKLGEWDEEETTKRVLPIVGDCVAEYLRHGNNGKFIAFGVTVAHCEELQRQFMAAGIPTGLYTYNRPEVERRDMIEEFRGPRSYLRGLISVSALAKGFDVADVTCVIVARPLRKSLTEHIQIIGRGLRKDPSDPSKVCTILDHAGNTLRFWDAMNAFFDEGATTLDDGKRKPKKKADKKARAVKKCPTCAHVHSPAPFCPVCGHEYPRTSNVTHEAGELSELGSGPGAAKEEREAVYAMLLWIAQERGRKPGWAAYTYKERYGVWPKHDVQPRQPSTTVARWVRSRDIAWVKGKKKRDRAASTEGTAMQEPAA